MKRTMVFIFIFALVVCTLTGCGSKRDDNTPVDPTPNVTVSPKPNGNNGAVNDGNGIIGDENGSSTNSDMPGEGILPEIGQDIEDGANDVIDGVENALDGNDAARGRGKNMR